MSAPFEVMQQRISELLFGKKTQQLEKFPCISLALLDHILRLVTPVTSGILESDICDHLPAFISILSFISSYSPVSYKFRRRLNKTDYGQFNNELYDILQRKCSHNGIGGHHNFITLISTLKTILEKHTPIIIRQSRRERKLAQKPWIILSQTWFQSS